MKTNKNNHNIKRILSAVGTFCLIVIILLSLIVVIKTSLTDDPSLLGYRFFYIISGSMEPEIPVTSAVITKRQSVYSIGDVITFCSSESAIFGCPNTHRIIEVMETTEGPVYQTKGDANIGPDTELVRFDDVYGKVILVTVPLNRVGSFLEFLLTPTGFFILLVIPMLLITVVTMKEFAKNCRASLVEDAQRRINQESTVSSLEKCVRTEIQSTDSLTNGQPFNNEQVDSDENLSKNSKNESVNKIEKGRDDVF